MIRILLQDLLGSLERLLVLLRLEEFYERAKEPLLFI